MGKIIGMPRNKKEENYRRRLWNYLSAILFILMSYISLNIFESNVNYWIIGIIFLIAGLYGVVSAHNNRRFIF